MIQYMYTIDMINCMIYICIRYIYIYFTNYMYRGCNAMRDICYLIDEETRVCILLAKVSQGKPEKLTLQPKVHKEKKLLAAAGS